PLRVRSPRLALRAGARRHPVGARAAPRGAPCGRAGGAGGRHRRDHPALHARARIEPLRRGRRCGRALARPGPLSARRAGAGGGRVVAPKHQAPRGTRDLLPGEIERWQWAEARTREVLVRYGYGEIRTPIFEDYELFARTSGESSEVVQKEMYRFRDLGDRDLALRPENTAVVC